MEGNSRYMMITCLILGRDDVIFSIIIFNALNCHTGNLSKEQSVNKDLTADLPSI